MYVIIMLCQLYFCKNFGITYFKKHARFFLFQIPIFIDGAEYVWYGCLFIAFLFWIQTWAVDWLSFLCPISKSLAWVTIYAPFERQFVLVWHEFVFICVGVFFVKLYHWNESLKRWTTQMGRKGNEWRSREIQKTMMKEH